MKTGLWSVSEDFDCLSAFSEEQYCGQIPPNHPIKLHVTLDIDYHKNEVRLSLIPIKNEHLKVIINETTETAKCKSLTIHWSGEVGTLRNALLFAHSALNQMYYIEEEIKTE